MNRQEDNQEAPEIRRQGRTILQMMQRDDNIRDQQSSGRITINSLAGMIEMYTIQPLPEVMYVDTDHIIAGEHEEITIRIRCSRCRQYLIRVKIDGHRDEQWLARHFEGCTG